MNHKTSFNKFKVIAIIKFFPVTIKCKWNQWWKKHKKIHRYIEIKQHTLKRPVGQKEIAKEIRKDLEKIKTQHIKSYGMQQKQCEEENL